MRGRSGRRPRPGAGCGVRAAIGVELRVRQGVQREAVPKRRPTRGWRLRRRAMRSAGNAVCKIVGPAVALVPGSLHGALLTDGRSLRLTDSAGTWTGARRTTPLGVGRGRGRARRRRRRAATARGRRRRPRTRPNQTESALGGGAARSSSHAQRWWCRVTSVRSRRTTITGAAVPSLTTQAGTAERGVSLSIARSTASVPLGAARVRRRVHRRRLEHAEGAAGPSGSAACVLLDGQAVLSSTSWTGPSAVTRPSSSRTPAGSWPRPQRGRATRTRASSRRRGSRAACRGSVAGTMRRPPRALRRPASRGGRGMRRPRSRAASACPLE